MDGDASEVGLTIAAIVATTAARRRVSAAYRRGRRPERRSRCCGAETALAREAGPHTRVSRRGLEQSDDPAVRTDVDGIGRRHFGQAGHGHDLTADRDHELGAGA